ncbi:MAG: radical SAM protein [Clostridiales bacterium]|nr:radical SAM protein [Clostridiales bacterium]
MRKFKQIYIEITNICNLNCSFCPKNNRPKKFMAVEEFNSITDEISPLTNTVCLHLMGEPLLHPNIKEIFEICNEKKLNVYLTTNGTLIKQNLDMLKSGCAKRISVSLHSFEANNNSISLDEYLYDVLSSCKEIADNSQTYIELRLWNDTNAPNAKNTLNTNIIEEINKTFNTNLSEQNLQRHTNITDKIYISFADTFDWPINTEHQEKNSIKFCYGLRSHFGILCDGTVVACCLDNEGRLALGNIFESKISDILNSPRAQNIYKGFTDRNTSEEFCKTCTYANKFLR